MKRNDMEVLADVVFTILAGILVAVLSVFATGYSASVFWNMAMPELFNLPTATARNGIGLAGLALCARWMISSGVSFTKE